MGQEVRRETGFKATNSEDGCWLHYKYSFSYCPSDARHCWLIHFRGKTGLSFVIAKPAHGEIIVYCFLSAERSGIIRLREHFFFRAHYCSTVNFMKYSSPAWGFYKGAEWRKQMEKWSPNPWKTSVVTFWDIPSRWHHQSINVPPPHTLLFFFF